MTLPVQTYNGSNCFSFFFVPSISVPSSRPDFPLDSYFRFVISLIFYRGTWRLSHLAFQFFLGLSVYLFVFVFVFRLSNKGKRGGPVWNPCIGCAGCAPQGFQCCANFSHQQLICAKNTFVSVCLEVSVRQFGSFLHPLRQRNWLSAPD